MPVFSDHSPIAVCIKVNATINKNNPSDYNYIQKPDTIVWNKALADKYVNLIQSPDCKESIRGFMNTGILPNKSSVDLATQYITDILVETAMKADMPDVNPIFISIDLNQSNRNGMKSHAIYYSSS